MYVLIYAHTYISIITIPKHIIYAQVGIQFIHMYRISINLCTKIMVYFCERGSTPTHIHIYNGNVNKPCHICMYIILCKLFIKDTLGPANLSTVERLSTLQR